MTLDCRHIIFSDNNNNYWVSGYNGNGECGIGNHNIEYIPKCKRIANFDNIQKKINCMGMAKMIIIS